MLETDDLFLGALCLVRGGELQAVEVRGTNGRRAAFFRIVGPVVEGAAREYHSERWSFVGWIRSGLLVADDPAEGSGVLRVDPVTGWHETWAEIQPRDPAGIMLLDLGTLVVTPDGRGYGYSWHRARSDL